MAVGVPPIAPITEALRGMIEQRKLLMSTIDGRIVKLSPKASGRKAAGQKADESLGHILSEGAVSKFIRETHPQYPLINLEDSKHRALSLRDKNKFKYWDQDTADEAMRCFMVPYSQQGILIWPDMADRKELIKDDRCRAKDKTTGECTPYGVKTMCPWCKKNDKVDFKCWEHSNVKTSPRKAIRSDAKTLPLVAPRLECSSIWCCGPVPDGELVKDTPNNRIIKCIKKKDEKKGKEQEQDYYIWEESLQRAAPHSFVLWSQVRANFYVLTMLFAFCM